MTLTFLEPVDVDQSFLEEGLEAMGGHLVRLMGHEGARPMRWVALCNVAGPGFGPNWRQHPRLFCQICLRYYANMAAAETPYPVGTFESDWR